MVSYHNHKSYSLKAHKSQGKGKLDEKPFFVGIKIASVSPFLANLRGPLAWGREGHQYLPGRTSGTTSVTGRVH